MKQIIGVVILVSLLATSVFYIKYLRSENNRLVELEEGYRGEITEITERAVEFEKISQKREQDIQGLNKRHKDFQNELKKAQQNKDFKNWFDISLPFHVHGLLEKNASD